MEKRISLQWFAAEDEGRTEEPSELKLKRARDEGRVAKSQDLNGAIVFLLCILMLLVLAKSILESFSSILIYFFTHVADKNFSYASMFAMFMENILKCALPVCGVGLVGGVVGNIIQNRGFIFSLKPIAFNFSKIVPNFAQYFKNTLFSFKGLFNIIKSLAKVAVIAAIAYFLIRSDTTDLLMSIRNGEIIVCVGKIADMAFQLMIISAVVFLIIAVFDYIVQRRSFMEEMKMTKYEQKQEYKEMEGDPEVKGHLKQMQKELLQQNIPKAVKESDVVITNPTHYAVSMKVNLDIDAGPRVTAKGVDEIAMRIKSIARENNVPQVENRPLARDLYNSVDIGETIPDNYWPLLAQIYAEIDKFKLKK